MARPTFLGYWAKEKEDLVSRISVKFKFILYKITTRDGYDIEADQVGEAQFMIEKIPWNWWEIAERVKKTAKEAAIQEGRVLAEKEEKRNEDIIREQVLNNVAPSEEAENEVISSAI